MFYHSKYKVQYIYEAWLITSTCFPIQNLKLSIYLIPIPNLAVTNTYLSTQNIMPNVYLQPVPSLGVGCKYLFSYPKYKAQHGTENWLVVGTYSPTQNIRPDVYLPLVPIYQTKIWSFIYTWGLTGHEYLITHPKYKT